MANRKRETPEERAQRDRQERVELLKMKQGLIEDSEIIPESGYVKPPEVHGWAKVANFFYINKAIIIISAVVVAILAIPVVQLITRERADLYVMAIAYDSKSEIGWRIDDIEKTLEKYCPDFDGNGKIHVQVNYIDRTTREKESEYDDIQAQKLIGEFANAQAQMFITDESFSEWIRGSGEINAEAFKTFFLEQTDAVSEDMLFSECGIRLNHTEFANVARWRTCPDNVIVLIRRELDNGTGNVKTNARNRERAMTVLQNILDNNVVNPDLTSE